jgi:hypothetical protein
MSKKSYRCIRRCWHNGHFYEIGAILAVENVSELPQDHEGRLRHFVPERDFSDEVVAETKKADTLANKKAPVIKTQKATG